jgi:hypothetical protein
MTQALYYIVAKRHVEKKHTHVTFKPSKWSTSLKDWLVDTTIIPKYWGYIIETNLFSFSFLSL